MAKKKKELQDIECIKDPWIIAIEERRVAQLDEEPTAFNAIPANEATDSSVVEE